MNIIKTELTDVLILHPKIWQDNRGYFLERYHDNVLKELGINYKIIQVNEAYSSNKGTLRGMGFQNNPYSQAKLVSCTTGSITDVVVDLRKGSPSYKKWIAIELDDIKKEMIYVPRGFGHGYITKCDHVIVNFMVDNPYMKDFDCCFRYDDPSINIQWGHVNEELMSEKDLNSPLFDFCSCNYIY